MKIEIRNIKTNAAFSEETICFKADVYVNGNKVAYAENDGRGGDTFYHAYDIKPSTLALLKEAEAYAKSLPSTHVKLDDEDEDGKTLTLDSNLESIIDDAIYTHFNKKEKNKEDKKKQKLMETNIVWGVPNGDFTHTGFVGKLKFADLMKSTKGKVALLNLYTRIKGELKEGEVIFNTNMPTSLNELANA